MQEFAKYCKIHNALNELYIDTQGKCRFCKSKYNRDYYSKKREEINKRRYEIKNAKANM
jgi:hypothetical protein